MFLKIGSKFVNQEEITHAVVNDDSVILYFTSSDFNAESNGHPSLMFHGNEAIAVIRWLTLSSTNIMEG